ncbi:phage terminase large subunit [Sporosarcina sp. ITBMC105]
MAYVNGAWLDYNARAARIALIESRADKLAQLHKAGLLTPSQVDTLIADKRELVRLKRVHRGEHDVLYFGMEYFSADGNPDNDENLIPAGVHVGNAADFHRQLCEMLNDVTKGVVKRNIAWACPRRHAKTAWLSNIYLVHQIVYRLRRYIVLFSETTDVAGDFISWGKFQLKLNAKLREDFGELLHVQPSRNDLDNKYEYITASNTKVEAKGLGTQTRGLRHGASRPDMFILDDLESDESTNTAELIEKSKTWFREEMLPAMAKDGICIYLGTILCYGSLLHYVIEERRDFESRKFAAIETYSTRGDLWEEWRKIYRSDVEQAADAAQQYYEKHKDEMLEGAAILWPGYFTYYELIVIREENGIKAFNQEYQNNPTDEERQIFKPEYITWFTDDDLADIKTLNYGAVDIAMGKEKGDFSDIVSGAVNTETGTLYIFDNFMERCHPDVLIDEVVAQTFEKQYEGLAVEAQMAQEFIADKMAERLQAKGYPAHTRVKQIKQRTRKALRIEALLPDIQSGKIRFHAKFKNSPEMEQFEMYPMHKHDDFPDAVSMLTMVAKSGQATVRTVKRMNRW